MSLLEWLKFWSKFYSLALFCRIPPSPPAPPPPEKWNLGRSWHFKTFQFQNNPPPRKWNLSGSPSLRVSEYPPPPIKIVRESKSESFRIPISEYQWETMCGKLPHVETLSNPNNYSFSTVPVPILVSFGAYEPLLCPLAVAFVKCNTATVVAER